MSEPPRHREPSVEATPEWKERVKLRLVELRMSRAALATKIGVSRTAITDLLERLDRSGLVHRVNEALWPEAESSARSESEAQLEARRAERNIADIQYHARNSPHPNDADTLAKVHMVIEMRQLIEPVTTPPTRSVSLSVAIPVDDALRTATAVLTLMNAWGHLEEHDRASLLAQIENSWRHVEPELTEALAADKARSRKLIAEMEAAELSKRKPRKRE